MIRLIGFLAGLLGAMLAVPAARADICSDPATPAGTQQTTAENLGWCHVLISENSITHYRRLFLDGIPLNADLTASTALHPLLQLSGGTALTDAQATAATLSEPRSLALLLVGLGAALALRRRASPLRQPPISAR